MSHTRQTDVSEYVIAFKGGPNGETIQPILQERLNYDASRFTAALQSMADQTDPDVMAWQQKFLQKEILLSITTVGLAVTFGVEITIPHILKMLYACFGLAKSWEIPVELTRPAMDYIRRDIPPNDPCAVVPLYHNAWWTQSVCPGEAETSTMTRENRHLCHTRHNLLRVRNGTPANTSSHTLPPTLTAAEFWKPKARKQGCKSCAENHSLATQCLAELETIRQHANNSATSLSGQLAEVSNRVSMLHSLRGLPRDAETPDADEAWNAWAAAHVPSSTVPASQNLASQDPDPDAAWESFAGMHSTKSTEPATTPPSYADSAQNDVLPSPGHMSLCGRKTPDPDDAWEAFNPSQGQTMTAQTTSTGPIKEKHKKNHRKRPGPKRKNPFPGAIDPDQLWASMGGDGPTPKVHTSQHAPNPSISPITPGGDWDLGAIDPDAMWASYEGHEPPTTSLVAPESDAAGAVQPLASGSSFKECPADNSSFCNDHADDASMSPDDSSSRFITPIRRITLPSPTFTSQARADALFFENAIDDNVFEDQQSSEMEEDDSDIEYM